MLEDDGMAVDLTPEEQKKKEEEEKLIRELHGIPEPEPEMENPPTPEQKEGQEEEEKELDPSLAKLPRMVVAKNVSRKASRDQISTLFGFLGKIEDMQIFPSDGVACAARAVFLKFANPLDAGIAVHLTNTIFIDRPLQCEIFDPEEEEKKGKFPEAAEGLKHITPLEADYMYGKTENDVDGYGVKKESLISGFKQYQTMNLEETPEMDRSVHVENLDGILVSEVSLVQFLAIAGTVQKIRITGNEAYVEFTHSKHVGHALKLNGAMFLGKPLKIRPATERDSLLKKIDETEKDDTMRRVLAAQSLIEDVVRVGVDEPPKVKKERVKKEHKVKRERSGSRDRSSSRRKKERRRSRSRDRSRDHKDRKRSRRSRSRDKKKKSRRRSRS